MSDNTIRPRGVNHFARVPNVNIPRSKFDLSHTHKTTFDGGLLIPVMWSDMLPGDSWKCTVKEMTRMTTPIVPFMDNVRITFHAFAVPKRLVWDNWEDYITGSHKGKLGTTHTVKPQVTVNSDTWQAGSLTDYFGLPKPSTSYEVDALPFRAYYQIFNDWYRDENLVDELPLAKDDLTVNASSFEVQRRGKRKDYFTSALPFVQKGPAVTINLGASAPVVGVKDSNGNSLATVLFDGTSYRGIMPSANLGSNKIGLTISAPLSGAQPKIGDALSLPSDGAPNQNALGFTSYTGLEADLSEAQSATINSLREAFAVQHLLERDARGGTRYIESLLSHFGVQSPDFRLQRAEYIGGGSIDFMVNSVAQTSASTSDTPQGNLAAVAKSAGAVTFQYSSVEHCILMVLACVTTDLTYQQGINRLWLKKSRTEEYWPEFAHLGEQPVFEREIWADAPADQVFGYQERFSEYRYFPGLITGKLRSTDPQSLDYWHLAQQFADAPSLSKTFIEENPPFDRVLAVQNEPQFICDMWFDCKVIRPLPVFSVPSLLDHF